MTAQVSEELILEAKKTSMAFCPTIPDDPDIITKIPPEEWSCNTNESEEFPDIFNSSACWRGYIGTWEIKDGKFFLNKLVGHIKLAKNEPIHATWFTGVLKVPQGKLVHYVHMGFGSLYEKELHIKIEAGMVTEQRVIDNAEKIKKLKNMTPEEQYTHVFRNMPEMEKLFDEGDW